MLDDNRNPWTRSIDARMAVLGLRGGEVRNALGMSRAGWSRIRQSNNPSFDTMKKVALVLAVENVSDLLSENMTRLLEPRPDWDWLSFIGDNRDKIFGGGQCPTWSQLAAMRDDL